MRLSILKTAALVFFLQFLLYSNPLSAQCGPNTPVFTVNLTGVPDSAWVSPAIQRNDTCCGATAPDVCIKFVITLDPGAVGISFGILSGAVPGGALFYQVNCGPPVQAGQPICLNGPGPHVLTFCKPGGNINTYGITSIPGPTASPNIIVNDGCIGTISATGFDPNTVSWSSIFPGTPGAYNNYLSCATCTTTQVTAQAGYPPFVDYVICGIADAACQTNQICDTVRVTFNPTLFANIAPQQPAVCFGQTSAVITANGTGGTPPYTYNWNTGATTQSITVGAGTYLVILGDASGCPPTTDTVVVTSFTNPITANAGADIYVCGTANPNAALSGSVTGVTTGIWSGGAGNFSPSSTNLNATYIPTASEISNGFIDLYLTTTNNGPCPGDKDTVRVFFTNFTGTIVPTVTPPNCNGGTNGSVSISVTGPYSPFTATWQTNPLQTGLMATNLSAGVYTYTVTNSLGCTTTQTVTVTQPPGLTSVMNVTNVNCAGTSTGSATVTPSGGTPGYSYSWTSGGNSANVGGLAAGTYFVTITDSKGCTIQDTAILTQPPVLNVSIVGNSPTCAGLANGTVSAIVTGGVPGYLYNWIGNGSTSSFASGLIAGSYTVNVTDAAGCLTQAAVTLVDPPPLTLTVNKTNETCDYANNGTASANVSGGTPNYTYLWQPGGFATQSINSVTAGIYTVTVTDNKGCQILTVFTISQPAPLVATISNVTNITCNGAANGAASAAVTGGTPLYNYSWNPAPGSGQGSSGASGMAAGNYTLTVFDAQGCVTTQTVTITQPTPLTTTLSIVNVNCNGTNSGSITPGSTGGTSPYSYMMFPGNVVGTTFPNLASGTYTVQTTDANGCTIQTTGSVTQPAQIIVNSSSTNSTCGNANGSASIVLGGGVGPYSITWLPTGGNGTTASNLLSGSYTVTVTDALGCDDVEIVVVQDNGAPTTNISATTNVACFGGSNGSATVSASGGAPPFTYQWSPTGGNGPTATGLTAGVYIVTVTDANGCQSQAITSPPITEPPPLALTLSQTAVSCNGGSNGSASSIVSGGTPNYTYLWSPGGSVNSSATGLSAGSYTLNVTDANGCPISSVISVTEPVALSATIAATSSVSCFGGNNGSASVTASNGTAPYSYSWSPTGGGTSIATGLSAGSYTSIVTDSKGCTFSVTTSITQPASPLFATVGNTQVSCFGGSDGTATANPSGGTSGYSYSWTPSGSASQTATGLTQGVHYVTVTDANGCAYTAATIVYQPSALTVSVSTINSTCGNANGIAYASVSGGTPGYSYVWSPTGGAGSNATGLLAGSYTLTVTDSKNCISTFPFTLANTAGPSITANVVNHVTCFGGNNGAASAGITGGTGPFQFAWTPSGSSSINASSLFAGTHSVIVYDNNSCSDTATVVITQPAQLTATVSVASNVSCFGGNNGSLSASVGGGSGPYNFSWSPSGGNASIASNLFTGAYTVTVTDANGCATQASGSISQPSQLSTSISASANPSCFGYQNGWMSAGSSGGTVPYTYSWSTTPAQSGNTATSLAAGGYTVTVTDANGCNGQANGVLIQPSQVSTNAGGGAILCSGASTNITASASGGSGNYTYYWNPGNFTGSSPSVSPTSTTQYTVAAYDANGCPGSSDTLSVTVYTLNSGNLIVTAFSPICPGTSTVVYAQVNGTPGPLTYFWNNGLGSGPGGFTVTPTNPTTYICTVTNSCGVTISDSVTVTFNPPPNVALTSSPGVGCVPLTVQFLDQSSGLQNDPINSWSWSFGNGNTSNQQNPSYTFNSAGVFNVTLTVGTIGGCSNSNATAPYTVTVYAVPVAAFNINTAQLDLPYDPLVTTNLSTGATQYVWDFGDGSSSVSTNATHLYSAPGTYTVELIAINAVGCSDTTTKVVEAITDIIFPNAFTPDPGGANDGSYSYNDYSNNVFYPFTAGVEKYRLLIFNRWGELIFESTDVKTGWNGYYRGEICQEDVYIWKAEVKFVGGRTFNKVGDVTLIR